MIMWFWVGLEKVDVRSKHKDEACGHFLQQNCSYPNAQSIHLDYKGQLGTWESQNGCGSEELLESVECMTSPLSVHLIGLDAFLVRAVRGSAIALKFLINLL